MQSQLLNLKVKVMQNVKTMVGNIAFTETGISVVRPYMDTQELDNAYAELSKDREERAEKAFKVAKKAIEARLEHCKSELEKNLAKATIISSDYIGWKGGHFSLPVYQALEKCLERNPQKWEDFNLLELQQVVRALHCQRCQISAYYEDVDNAFMIATELMLCYNREDITPESLD